MNYAFLKKRTRKFMVARILDWLGSVLLLSCPLEAGSLGMGLMVGQS